MFKALISRLCPINFSKNLQPKKYLPMKLPSALATLFFALVTIVFAALHYVMDSEQYIGLIVGVLGLAVAFVLAPQIDWWWYKRYPRDIDPQMANLFQQHLPFYQRLSDAEKLRFRQRTDLYLMAAEFIIPSQDEDKSVPEDLKHWVAAYSAMTTWGKLTVENEKFEKIVAYMHPFPSPQFPQHLHTSEIFEEDGVLLFALERMIQAVMSPTLCFNPVLYDFCRVHEITYPSEKLNLNEANWLDLEQISSFSKQKISEDLGLPDVDIQGAAMSFYLLFPSQFEKTLPKEFAEIRMKFGF